MNPRLELFMSGSAFYVGHVRARRGRLVAVFARRPKSAKWRARAHSIKAIRLFKK